MGCSKKQKAAAVLLLMTVLLAGCSFPFDGQGGRQANPEEKSMGNYLYFLNNTETQLVREPYEPQETAVEELVKEYLTALTTVSPKDITCKRALPEDIKVTPDENLSSGQLTLDFDEKYHTLKGASEILCRAAVVKTLCQIEGIDYIEFKVDGQPIVDSSDNPIGFMQAQDFIDNTGGETKYRQSVQAMLYFADSSGKKLKETRVKINYDGTISLEKLIIAQLCKGPDSIDGVEKGSMLQTIPEKTVLNKATVKDGTCYVDFGSHFLDGVEDVTGECTVYSVVNSLAEVASVTKVQITVDGQTIAAYKDGVSINGPLERNLDLIAPRETKN